MSVVDERRKLSKYPSTAAITPGGLSVRLLRYFIHKDGKMVARSEANNAHCRFRHMIGGKPYLVQLISAEPSRSPKKWELKFITLSGPRQFATLTVDEPALRIKLTEAQPA